MPLLIIIFLIVSHGNWFSVLPTFSFIFSWRWCLRWQLKFSLVSPMYTRDINVIIKCVFIILLLICLLLRGRGWGSSQWRTQKGEGKLFFFLYTDTYGINGGLKMSLPEHWSLSNLLYFLIFVFSTLLPLPICLPCFLFPWLLNNEKRLINMENILPICVEIFRLLLSLCK